MWRKLKRRTKVLHKIVWSDGPEDWSDTEQEQMLRGVCFGKGGKAPAPAPTTSTVNQSNLPEYAEPFFTGLLERTEDASLTDYTPYEGQRIAEFSPDTQAGFSALRDQAQSGTPAEFTTATNTLTGSAGAADLTQQGQNAGYGSYTDAGVAQQYMNPYITNVLDVQKQRLDQRFNEQQLSRNDQAMGAGAFGGDRRFVNDQIANRERNMLLNEVDAQGLAQAYQSGSEVYGREQALDLQNRGLNNDIFAGNRQGMLDQDRNRMAAAEQLRAQGLANDELSFNRAKTLAGVGGALDDKAQTGLDVGYSDFVNQRDYDRNQLNFYSGILRGVPISPQQETTTYQTPPSQISQLLGLGIGGLGLAKALGS
jgi:hypothetical protein